MNLFHHESSEAKAHNQISNVAGDHKAKLSHELIVAAASYEAAKAYEKHQAAHGKPASHEKAKEFMAAAAGGFIDRLVETKGLDAVDAAKVKHDTNKKIDARAKEDF